MSWAHHHGEACRSCPDLKEVLEGQCWGSVKAVWGCVEGHRYIMDTHCTTTTASSQSHSSGALGSASGDGMMSEEEEQEQEGEEDEEEQPGGNGMTSSRSVSAAAQRSPPAAAAQSSVLDEWTGSSEGGTVGVSALIKLHSSSVQSKPPNFRPSVKALPPSVGATSLQPSSLEPF